MRFARERVALIEDLVRVERSDVRIETRFGIIARLARRRGSFGGAGAPTGTIDVFTCERNDRAPRFVWVAEVERTVADAARETREDPDARHWRSCQTTGIL